MARPARPERSRSAQSSRQLSRFYHSINLDRVFGTHTYLFDPTSPPAPRYTIFRQQEQGTTLTRDGTFGLSALAAGRTRKMMEPFLLTPPLKSAPRASHPAQNILFAFHRHIAPQLHYKT